MKKLLLCWLPLILFPFFKGYAQVPVSGTVKDTQGGVLPGVSIKLKGTTTGVTTTSSGTYSISVPDASAVLVFSFIGMFAANQLHGTNANNPSGGFGNESAGLW